MSRNKITQPGGRSPRSVVGRIHFCDTFGWLVKEELWSLWMLD